MENCRSTRNAKRNVGDQQKTLEVTASLRLEGACRNILVARERRGVEWVFRIATAERGRGADAKGNLRNKSRRRTLYKCLKGHSSIRAGAKDFRGERLEERGGQTPYRYGACFEREGTSSR